MDSTRQAIRSILTEAKDNGWVFKQESWFRDQYRPTAFSGVYKGGIVNGDFLILDSPETDPDKFLVILWFASKEKGHTKEALQALKDEYGLPIIADDVDNREKRSYWNHMRELDLIVGVYGTRHTRLTGWGPRSSLPDRRRFKRK